MSSDDVAREDITMTRGDSLSWVQYITDADGNPRNITGSTTTFGAKHGEDDTDYVIDVTGTITDYAGGQVAFLLPPSATASLSTPAVLVYDIEFNEGDLRVTLQSGRLTVLPDVLH